jgi:Sulfotransferase family
VADDGPQPRGPIFIVGAMGAGTTLLRLVLGSHERIAIPEETGFMRAVQAHRFIPFWYFGSSWYKRLGYSAEEFDEHLRAFYSAMFSRYAERAGKDRWGEKTPWHVWHIDEMARLFPDAAFVAIVRHPGANAASNMKRFGFTLRASARHYARYNGEIARMAAAHGSRFHVVRYEDLVLEPERVLRELLRRLGEPWSPRVLEHHLVQGGRREVEGSTLVDDPIDASRISKWTAAIDDRGRRRLTRRLGRLAEFYGYSVEDPVPRAPLPGDGGLVAGGADIERRIGEFDDLDLLAAPTVPLVELAYRPRKVRLVARTAEPPAPTPPKPPPASPARRLLRAGVRRLPRAARGRVRAVRRRLGG